MTTDRRQEFVEQMLRILAKFQELDTDVSSHTLLRKSRVVLHQILDQVIQLPQATRLQVRRNLTIDHGSFVLLFIDSRSNNFILHFFLLTYIFY